MTTNNASTVEFLTATWNEIDDQTTALRADFDAMLHVQNYKRETVLNIVCPWLAIRTIPARDKLTKEDIAYSAWLIGELKGQHQAQLAHKTLRALTPQVDAYNYLLHARIIGALRAETQLLSNMIEIFTSVKPKTSASLLDDLAPRVPLAQPQDNLKSCNSEFTEKPIPAGIKPQGTPASRKPRRLESHSDFYV